jgi:hypothetical protein
MDGRVTRSDHSDGRPAGVQRRRMSGAIDADREPRHDARPHSGQVRREARGDGPAVVRRPPRPDDSHGGRQVEGARTGLVETMGGGTAGLDGNGCVVVVLGA